MKQGEETALKFANSIISKISDGDDQVMLNFAKILEKTPKLLKVAVKGVIEV